MIIPASHICRIPLPLADTKIAKVRHGLKFAPPIVHVSVAINGMFHAADPERFIQRIDADFIHVDTSVAIENSVTMILVEFHPGDFV